MWNYYDVSVCNDSHTKLQATSYCSEKEHWFIKGSRDKGMWLSDLNIEIVETITHEVCSTSIRLQVVTIMVVSSILVSRNTVRVNVTENVDNNKK